MAGPLGRALKSVGGPGKRLAKKGVRASYWASNRRLIRQLKRKPSKIIISLNGNGITGTSDLVNLIATSVDPETPVIWSGAPPPIRRRKSWKKALTSDEGFLKTYNIRKGFNETVRGIVEAQGWTFIDPYDYIKFDQPKIVGNNAFESGYVCSNCDGIHLPKSVAVQYANKISGIIS